jgi:hypothetical protein
MNLGIIGNIHTLKAKEASRINLEVHVSGHPKKGDPSSPDELREASGAGLPH